METLRHLERIEVRGTSAERSGLKTTDLPTDKLYFFYESDTKNKWLWIGNWVQIEAAGAALVTTGIAGTEHQMLTNAIAIGTGTSTQLSAAAGTAVKAECVYMATLGANNTIAATATIKIYGSRVVMASAGTANKVELATLSLSGTGDTNNDTVVDTDAVAVGSHFYPYIWAEITAISGTGAKVQAWRLI